MNKCELIGRLARDPEMRETQSGISVVSFTLAVDRRFKDKNGERGVDWISCKAFRQTAEFICKYFQKGQKLAVVGSIQTGSYEKNGQKIYTTDVVVDEAYFVESKNSGDAADYQRSDSRASKSTTTGTQMQEFGGDDTSLPFDL